MLPSLVPLDEVGTGTDANQGAALPTAVVNHFKQRGAPARPPAREVRACSGEPGRRRGHRGGAERASHLTPLEHQGCRGYGSTILNETMRQAPASRAHPSASTAPGSSALVKRSAER